MFRDIGLAGGGDAVDVSGSTIRVERTRFERIDDKAISVGEGSTMSAFNVTVDGAGAAAVAKDRSTLILDGADFKGVRVGHMMAYIKKPEYGPAKIIG